VQYFKRGQEDMLNKFVFFVKTLRLRFVIITFLPFLFGYCIEYRNGGLGNKLSIIIGLYTIACFYLSTILFNDSFAKRLGQDWQRARFFSFTDELAPEVANAFSLRFYFILATVFAFFGVIGNFALNLIRQTDFTYVWMFIILFLAWAYQVTPPEFSFSAFGELILFILFGPILVMYGYFIRTGSIFSLEPLILSLPFGFLFLTLIINREILGYEAAKQRKERNLVILFGKENAYIIYFFLIVLIFSSFFVIHHFGFIKAWIFLVSLFLIIGLRVVTILKRHYNNQDLLKQALALTCAQYLLFILGMFTVIML